MQNRILSFFIRALSAVALPVVMLSGVALPAMVSADAIDDLEASLRENVQVQEKIYIHTDNSAYFIGDTLWYKAYVMRADDLRPTDMSKLLYVELLTPDGYVVERQHVVVSGNGLTCGQFALPDSLYSGFYEVRAYTRWQLNFNVTERDYSRDDRMKFAGKDAARDFFRDWEGLSSRVIPIYNKPQRDGDYGDRYMNSRPKQRLLKDKKFLTATFYPEGGSMIAGVPCNIAFEVRDNHGQQFEMTGTLSDGTTIRTQHGGRGQFLVRLPGVDSSPADTHAAKTLKARFTWEGKEYSFSLPKAKKEGLSLVYDALTQSATLHARGVTPAAYSVMCRGQLKRFERLSPTTTSIGNITDGLPTGVNELIVYDASGQPLASRLFFVNNHDMGKTVEVTMTCNGQEVGDRTTLDPYAPVTLEVKAPVMPEDKGVFSVAVRDAQTDERGYDTGNMMTDVLLSSELKGFIAYPDYYFASDDEEHVQNLDLLMKIQGWRRYKSAEIRYEPEKQLTYEGTVNKVPFNAGVIELEDLESVNQPAKTVAQEMLEKNMEMSGSSLLNENENENENGNYNENENENENDTSTSSATDDSGLFEDSGEDVEIAWADNSDVMLSNGRVKKAVLVEAELAKDGQVAGVVTHTDKNGHFIINLPAFYDKAVLMVKAYTKGDSLQKNMQSRADKKIMDERSFPDFYVKQDKFFPIFSQPYSWYQVNSPELLFVDDDADEVVPQDSKLSGNHTLQTVVVKAKRRGRRAIDRTKPAIVRDMYDVYNDVTDYGLMWGIADFRRMPMAVATYLFGNMGRRTQFNIRALVEGTSFYRNYTPMESEYDKNTVSTAMLPKLTLGRLENIKVFTDYELRTDSGDVMESNVADVEIDFVPLANDAKRYSYRDRRYILDGVTYPEAFYSPDYSGAVPAEPTDYRRTLYWNPNVRVGEDGVFRTTFYNNCRETRVKVSAAGTDAAGGVYFK